MVLMRRQSSASGPEYCDYDSSAIKFQQHKSDRSFFVDPELRSYQDSDYSSKKKKPSNSGRSPLKLIFIVFQYVLFGALVYVGWNTKKTLESVTDQLNDSRLGYQSLSEILRDTERELDKAHNDFDKLKVKLTSVNPLIVFKEGVESSSDRQKISETLISRHEAQANRIAAMQESIQESHKRNLMAFYGTGPYLIQVEVVVDGKTKFFTIETAPIELMPHAVYSFMEMVKNKVWDETLFIHKVDHVVLAAPIDEEGKLKDPTNSKPLLFPEYSEKFPHVKNTIGFQGRPGGPEIYINLDDNRDHHGPGGQKQHDLVEEADPCFGVITKGVEVLDEFRALSRKAQSLGEDEIYYSKIVSMKYIGNKM